MTSPAASYRPLLATTGWLTYVRHPVTISLSTDFENVIRFEFNFVFCITNMIALNVGIVVGFENNRARRRCWLKTVARLLSLCDIFRLPCRFTTFRIKLASNIIGWRVYPSVGGVQCAKTVQDRRMLWIEFIWEFGVKISIGTVFPTTYVHLNPKRGIELGVSSKQGIPFGRH